MSQFARDKTSRLAYESSFQPYSSELSRRGQPQLSSQRPPSSLFQSKNPLISSRSAYLSSKSSDFFSILTSQMRRIDENFSLEWSDETPLQQALTCLVQAIEVIESEKASLASFSPELRPLESSADLKVREEELSSRESLLTREKLVLSAEKEKIKKLKEHYLALEAELKLQREELEESEQFGQQKIEEIKEQLEIELENISENKRKVDREAAELELLRKKLEDYKRSIESEREIVEADRAQVFDKNLELEKIKWSLETEKAQLEEKIAINLHLREKIEQELKEIDSQRAELLQVKIELQTHTLRGESKSFEEERLALQSERLALAEERERLLLEEEKFAQLVSQYENEYQGLVKEKQIIEKDKIAVLEEREAVDEAWDELEEKQDTRTGEKKDIDYAIMIEDLQAQMAGYTKELEAREQQIEERAFQIAQREAEVEKKLEEIQNVEYSLLRAKHDLEELSLGTIPELESQSQHIQHILADLLQKRSEVDHGYSQLQAKIQEFERTKNQSRNTNDINRMADELENRLKKIREREEELASLEEVLEKDKKENLAHALFLQRAQREFDESCERKEAEIEATTKKLEKLQAKLESAILLMNAKESELLGMKEFIMEGRNKINGSNAD